MLAEVTAILFAGLHDTGARNVRTGLFLKVLHNVYSLGE